MRKKLLAIALGMVLAGMFTGCGSKVQSGSASEIGESAKNQETEENNQKFETEVSETEKYEIGPDTYVSPYKYMITLPTINKGTRCAEVCGGTKGFYSVVAVQGIGEDMAKLYNIDLNREFSDEEIIEAVQPSAYSMLGNLHDTKGRIICR